MTDKEKIKAKVIKLRNELLNDNHGAILSRTVYRYFNKVNEFIDSLHEEPVSEDLEEVAKQIGQKYFPDAENIWARPNIEAECAALAFKCGANWQKQQFEKNRLAACERLTREEAEREQDFVMSIFENEHRQPTYSDAIEYGMRVQKQLMMKDAVEGVYDCDDDNSWIEFKGWAESTSKAGCKVKVIIIKEDEK